jgi:hypothetical protein
MLSGAPEEALDCACGLYLGETGAWLETRADDSPMNF